MTNISQLLRALRFSAGKHRDQRRKNREASPYINHPIEVAETLARIGGVEELAVLQAAILHDTIEDTETSGADIEQSFGREVRELVEAVSDDKSLPKQERKQRQVEHAPQLSRGAKLIKLADKICNVSDLALSPPADWDQARLLAYLDWAEQVMVGLRGTNEALELTLDRALADGRSTFGPTGGDGVS